MKSSLLGLLFVATLALPLAVRADSVKAEAWEKFGEDAYRLV